MNNARVVKNELTDGSYTADVELLDQHGDIVCVLNCASEYSAMEIANRINGSVNGVQQVMTDWN